MGLSASEIQVREEVSYRDSPRINQSFLKDIIKNVTRSDEPTEAMEDGNVVDCIITTPQLFYEKYEVRDLQVPPEQFKAAIDMIAPNSVFSGMEMNRIDLLRAFREVSDLKWKDDTVWEKMMTHSGYFNALWEISNSGKKLLSTEQYEKATIVVNNLLSGKTGHWLEADGFIEEIQWQVPIYFDYELDGEVFECKALLDALRINHVEKTVRMIDIKTTGGSTKYWSYLAKQLRYDIQASFYQEALKFKYPDWKVEMPVFLVESIKYPGKPRDFICTQADLHTGKYGCEISKGFTVMGRCPEGIPCNYEERVQHELGFEDALRILKQSKEMGLSDYDVDYFHHVNTKTPYELNVFL